MARKITVSLTEPQAYELLALTNYVLIYDPESFKWIVTPRVLKNARAALRDALWRIK